LTERSTLAKSLWAVSLVVALISLVTFSTVAYSGYQEFRVVVTPSSGFKLGIASNLNGTSYSLRIAGTVPNRGLYSVEFDGIYSLQDHGTTLVQAPISPVTIQPGRVQNFTDTIVLNILRIGNATELKQILLNGTSAEINGSATFRLGPLASLSVSNSSAVVISAPLGQFKVGHPTTTNNGRAFEVPISFTDESAYKFPYALYAELRSAEGAVANTTLVSGTSLPGQTSALTLQGSLTTPLQSGGYAVVVHLLLSTRDIALASEVLTP
jgi:hypothetical protein